MPDEVVDERVTVHARVQIEEVKPKRSGQSIEVKMTTAYALEKLDGLTEAMMNCAGGVAELTLAFTPEQSDLFDGEDDEDDGQQELEE